MAYVIAEPCISRRICARCLGQALCPVDALRSSDGFAYVDPALCIDCGLCEAACPFGVVHTTEPIFARGRWKRLLPQQAWQVAARNREAAG